VTAELEPGKQGMEPPADASWLKMEPVHPRPRWMQRWTVEHRMTGTQARDPFVQPTWLRRKAAERYARRHTCDHHTYTVVPVVKACCNGGG
jgi:hypothetical protein